MRFSSRCTILRWCCKLLQLLALAWPAWSPPVLAENLGHIGATYPITETDARKYLQAEAGRQVGSARAAQDVMRKSALGFLDNLPPLQGVGRVERNQTRYMDLVHVFARDISDAKGRVVAKAGTRIDLLRHSRLDGFLMLLDGRDQRQVLMLQRMWRAGYEVNPILVAGSYAKLSKSFNRPFYYDYGGVIATRFGVARVPAVIGQDGNRIRIEEMKP